MVALEPSVVPPGEAEALAAAAGAEAFGSPVGMRRINRAAWERLAQDRGGMIMSPPAVASPHGALPGPSPLGMSPLGMPGATPHSAAPAPAPAADAAGPNDKSRLGKRTAAQRLEDETAMPPPEAKRAKTGDGPDAADRGVSRAENESETREAMALAERDAAAALAQGVSDLFKHGGEASGTVPLRNVLFAKSLKRSNGFLSAVEKLDASSPEALIAAAERVATAIRETQAVSNVDVFDDLMGRLEALNASASHAAAVAINVEFGNGKALQRGDRETAGVSPVAAAPEDAVTLLAVGVLCARVFRGGYRSGRGVPTRMAHALLSVKKLSGSERFGLVGAAVIDASLNELGFDGGGPDANQKPEPKPKPKPGARRRRRRAGAVARTFEHLRPESLEGFP